eukprot:m.63192 g.63192  ORF g.63192 m.63192 type:complete len:595 (-) comp23254_c0_seq1:70-1854(-)
MTANNISNTDSRKRLRHNRGLDYRTEPQFSCKTSEIPQFDTVCSKGNVGSELRRLRSRSSNNTLRIVDRDRHRYKPGVHSLKQREFYTSIYPNTCAHEIDDDPTVAIRKFSPCGRYLITFSRTSGVHYVHVFRMKSGYRPTKETPTALWQHYFVIHFSAVISQGNQMLNKDFCLFSSDAQYLLVASTTAQPDVNESPQERFPQIKCLEDITLHVVDMKTGVECSKRKFELDYISLAHNAGIYLRRDLVAVLSSYRQKIHLFRIREGGQLHHLQTIGDGCYPDDELFLSQTRCEPPRRAPPAEIPAPTSLAAIMERAIEPIQEPAAAEDEDCIFGLRQRILTFLFRRAHLSDNSASGIRYFHHHFSEFSSLCIWRMQLLDDRHLLLKYGSRDHVGSRSNDSMGIHHAFFVVYDFITTEVISMFENNSQELLQIYESSSDLLFEETEPGVPFLLPLPSNSFFAREAFRKHLYTARTARNGGIDQSIRRSLGELPVAPQNYRESPYFDLGLYSYDEKLISHAERLKHCSEFPVKFYSRKHGGVVFKVPTGKKIPEGRSQKKLASFLFHPFLPFAITIQHVIHNTGQTSSHTNFHFRQ